MNQAEVEALPVEELQQKLNLARQRMQQAGAHFVADGIWEVPAILQTINTLLARGEKPF